MYSCMVDHKKGVQLAASSRDASLYFGQDAGLEPALSPPSHCVCACQVVDGCIWGRVCQRRGSYECVLLSLLHAWKIGRRFKA
jgi:hypothetical protein